MSALSSILQSSLFKAATGLSALFTVGYGTHTLSERIQEKYPASIPHFVLGQKIPAEQLAKYSHLPREELLSRGCDFYGWGHFGATKDTIENHLDLSRDTWTAYAVSEAQGYAENRAASEKDKPATAFLVSAHRPPCNEDHGHVRYEIPSYSGESLQEARVFPGAIFPVNDDTKVGTIASYKRARKQGLSPTEVFFSVIKSSDKK